MEPSGVHRADTALRLACSPVVVLSAWSCLAIVEPRLAEILGKIGVTCTMVTSRRHALVNSEVEQVWQRIRRWAVHAMENKISVETLQRGVMNYITDVAEGSIGRSSQGRTSSSRASRADVEKIWEHLQAERETSVPEGVLYFAMALMVAALDEVEHVGDGVIRLVGRPAPVSEEPITAQTVEAEANRVESFPVRTRAEVRIAARREAELVVAYAAHLEGRAVVRRRRYGQLVCDIFIESRAHLIEAKADASRESIRMAIGQLFDYRRFEPTLVRLGVLVPERPARDLLELLDGLDIACVWSGDGFEDNRGGEFA